MELHKRTEVIICFGSSCFARGNKKLFIKIQSFIKDNHLDDRVIFKGNHCFGKCSSGPVLKIGENIYEHVSDANLLEILEKELG